MHFERSSKKINVKLHKFDGTKHDGKLSISQAFFLRKHIFEHYVIISF